MKDDKKPVNSMSKRLDFLHLLELLPRKMWVEDADNLLLYSLFNQETEEEPKVVARLLPGERCRIRISR